MKANIPIEHVHFELKDLITPDVQAMKLITEDYIKTLNLNIESGFGLYLYGGHGTGKTTLGCIILKESIKQRYSSYFATLEDCVNLVSGGWRNPETRDEFQENIINSDILLVDDVGGLEINTGGNKALISSTFTSLFRDRSHHKQSTIVTSNLSPDALYDQFGSHIYSSFMQYLRFVNFPSDYDHRQNILSPQRDNPKAVKRGTPRKGLMR
jgi:DNA replication protein DnaC